MFIPNKRCLLARETGTSLYGKATYAQPVSIPCGVIRLEKMSEQTTVRADSSASRGSGMEDKILSRILVPAYVKVKNGDKITLDGFNLVVQSVWPRYAVDAGRLDHWQLDLLILVE